MDRREGKLRQFIVALCTYVRMYNTTRICHTLKLSISVQYGYKHLAGELRQTWWVQVPTSVEYFRIISDDENS